MCGRFRLSRRKQLVGDHFDSVSGEEDWNPRYNIAPTQPVAVVRQNPTQPVRELSLMRWGLIPPWAKDSSAGARMINARRWILGRNHSSLKTQTEQRRFGIKRKFWSF